MKERIAGIISFAGGVGGFAIGIFGIIVSFEEVEGKVDPGAVLAIILLLSVSISTVLYTIWTKFWKIKNSEVDKLEYQIRVMQKQIELQELSKKIDSK